MRIVILMGGIGSRFSAVGYEKPKPFLMVDGKAMLRHVLGMYPGDHEFILVSNENFIGSSTLAEIQNERPDIRVVPIPAHKLGPVHSLSFIWAALPAHEPVLVSYCDFSAGWDFSDFAKQVSAPGIDGAVPSYTGFHPHLLHKKKYAGIIAGKDRIMEKIKEKHSFTENPEDSFHSAGNYYFSHAGEAHYYTEKLIADGKMLNGEHYLSMIYYYYLAEKKNILVYPLVHFLQWGTPEDLEEYEAWSMLLKGQHKGITDIPESRKEFIRIPHAPESLEYKKSHTYWKEYFLK